MKQGEKPKYAHLEYNVRAELDISWAEYVLCDMIYYLSRRGWCNKKLKDMQVDMGLSKFGIIKMLKRLEERNLIEKSDKGYRTLQRYESTKLTNDGKKVNKVDQNQVGKVNKVDHEGQLSLPRRSTKLTNNRGQSYIENNKRIKGDKKSSEKYQKARKESERIRNELASKGIIKNRNISPKSSV